MIEDVMTFPICPICNDEIYDGDEYDDETPKHYWCVVEVFRAEAEGQKARADWLDDLLRKAHSLLSIVDEEAAERLWTAYSTPPQFDKDGAKSPLTTKDGVG